MVENDPKDKYFWVRANGPWGHSAHFGENFTFTQLFKNMIKIIFISAVSNKIEGFYIKHCGVNFDQNLIAMQKPAYIAANNQSFSWQTNKNEKEK